jgi:hypothetical protein
MALPLIACALLSGAAHAATFEICRTVDVAELPANLLIPAQSLFRDDGRADDPLAAFNGDRWRLRVETIAAAMIPALQSCARVQVRITSDSSVKSVSVADNRRFTYAGSSLLLDRPDEPEELLSTTGRVLDQVP